MTRSCEERIADVRRLLAAACEVFDDRRRLTQEISRVAGLTPEGVELGFGSLEREASDADLGSLVRAAGDAPHVHVILSANVFVAPLRAIAFARAAAGRVSVRPSPRDPLLARELLERAGDPAIVLAAERDAGSIEGDATIHVYGRDETIAAVRAAARPGVIVRGHGAGLGVAVVTAGADLARAAEALAADVVPFDQRGCLSPRLAFVEGQEARAEAFAFALHEQLGRWGALVPRGELTGTERAEVARWSDAMAFAGLVLRGADHAVAAAPAGTPRMIAPAGRHVQLHAIPTLRALAEQLTPLKRAVVAVGSDDPARVAPWIPPHARLCPLGRMQHPPLDGPVDRRLPLG